MGKCISVKPVGRKSKGLQSTLMRKQGRVIPDFGVHIRNMVNLIIQFYLKRNEMMKMN